MNYYIPHCILVINDPTEESINQAMVLAFQWANEMGRNGKTVSHLHLVKCHDNVMFDKPTKLMCMTQCTKEEREHWEELQKLNIKNAVFTALREDNETS